ncbi:(Fe-S)-binding protein [Desulfobulbus sp.]|uniref:(Fe-S)-binding protein n=1 Tax=Desulfobulbus sp. TaxID=895 RepID=UPI00286F209E|nr:(Fe-S)-binding protein [Desulfobulbus sp.]
MADGKQLEEFGEQIAQCVRCGACQAHCPVYLETGREGSVARGKIVLAAAVLAGEAELDERLREEIGLCLLCGSCVAKCPNRVPTDAIVAALRRRIAGTHGLTALAKGVAALTGSKPLLGTLVKGADLLAPLLFRKIPATSGLRLRFGPAALKDRSLPPLPDRTLFARVPAFLQGDPAQPTVGIFAGCALTYLYPQVGEILARLPHRLGCSVHLPRSQGCCGMPALSSGNGPLVATLAEANIGAFAGRDLDCILTACASCRGMLAAYAEETGQAPVAELVDIHVFLQRQGLVDQLTALPKWPHRLRVAYHDPCHLRTAGITREPRALLGALPQADLVEMEDAGLCCGLGGTFTAAHPDLSRAIGDRKLAGLRASGATVVASGCPGCILQLQDIIDRAGLAIKAVHTLELIQQALTEPPA